MIGEEVGDVPKPGPDVATTAAPESTPVVADQAVTPVAKAAESGNPIIRTIRTVISHVHLDRTQDPPRPVAKPDNQPQPEPGNS